MCRTLFKGIGNFMILKKASGCPWSDGEILFEALGESRRLFKSVGISVNL
jgi:hypothetical protein